MSRPPAPVRPPDRDVLGAPDTSVSESERDRLERRLFAKRRHQGRLARWRPWLISLLVLALLAGGAWVVLASPWLRAEEVRVEGVSLLQAEQVRAAAEVPWEPLARLDTAAIARRVRTLRPVESVRVRRAWPNTVVLTVRERTAVAALVRDGSWVGMDAHGVTFRTWKTRPPALPEIAADSSADADARVEAARVLASLSPELLARVQHLEVTSIDGIALVMRPRGGVSKRVIWGSAAESEQKADVLAALIRQKVRVIDVSVPGRPTTRA